MGTVLFLVCLFMRQMGTEANGDGSLFGLPFHVFLSLPCLVWNLLTPYFLSISSMNLSDP